MNFTIFLLLAVHIEIIFSEQNVTKFDRKQIFLSRRKRYVQWPKGSNFVINFTCTKPLLRYQPLTWNTVYEMDVPFAVESDIFRKKPESLKTKRSVLERRILFDNLSDFVTLMGLNGQACIQKLLCEAEDFMKLKQKSLLEDLVKVLFRFYKESLNNYDHKCDEEVFSMCPISLLSIFINSSIIKEQEENIISNDFLNNHIIAM
ncbi:uncharacterized protein LOC126735634 [Anthonomus grandis grandis]|uniref:uncharacterized protein LOC126735634 n=1 Tax=Anthonomus grandis grandis TaxID=2921223 RepID=UPI0021656D8D|nr:uncharacterized protein LOC126735634 [Anthonomus grandis grandis]